MFVESHLTQRTPTVLLVLLMVRRITQYRFGVLILPNASIVCLGIRITWGAWISSHVMVGSIWLLALWTRPPRFAISLKCFLMQHTHNIFNNACLVFQIKIWDMQKNECAGTLPHRSAVLSVVSHPNLPVLVTGTEDGHVYLWCSINFR